MDTLDLSQHDVEASAGKRVEINRVAYELQPLLGRGHTVFVFPMKNLRSGLVQFVARIYRPGSHMYDKCKSVLMTERHFSARVRVEESRPFKDPSVEDPYSFQAQMPIGETYECRGGLLQMQLLVPSDGLDPNCLNSQQKEVFSACQLLAGGDFHAASEQLDAVMLKNENHTDAMFFKVDCLLASGEVDEAESLARRAIDIEPNDPQLYHRLAKVLLIGESAAAACAALEKTLDRWPWDFPTLYVQTCTAIDWGLDEIAQDGLSRALRLAPESKAFAFLKSELEADLQTRRRRAKLTAEAGRLIDHVLTATQTHPIELWSKCRKVLHQVERHWRVRFTRRRCKTFTTYGTYQWPFQLSGQSIVPSAVGVDRLHPAEDFGFFPAGTAFEDACDLVLLGVSDDVRGNRIALWRELLRRLYFTYEMGSEYPGVPFGFEGLVRGEQFKHVSTKSRTRGIHLGWQSIKEGNVMFLDGVERITFEEDGVLTMTYSGNGKRLTRYLCLRSEDELRQIINSVESQFGSFQHVKRRLSKWEAARVPLLAVTGFSTIILVIGFMLIVFGAVTWSLGEIAVVGMIMLLSCVVPIVLAIRERPEIDHWEPALP